MNVKKVKPVILTADSLLGKKRKIKNSRGARVTLSILFAVYTALLLIPFSGFCLIHLEIKLPLTH